MRRPAAVSKAGVCIPGWQGAGTAELLEAFDVLRFEHEARDVDKYNDDVTYKAGINEVRRGEVSGCGPGYAVRSLSGESYAARLYPLTFLPFIKTHAQLQAKMQGQGQGQGSRKKIDPNHQWESVGRRSAWVDGRPG